MKDIEIYFTDGNTLVGTNYPDTIGEHIAVAIECGLPIKLQQRSDGKTTIINPRYVIRAEVKPRP